MGYLPKYRQDPLKVHYLFRDELLRCEIYGKEAQLLSKYHVSTSEDLAELKSTKTDRYEMLSEERDELRKAAKRKLPPETVKDLRNRITLMTGEMKKIRSELKLIEDIKERSAGLESKVLQAEIITERKETTR